MIEIACFHLFSALFYRVSGFFPKTAWRFNPYRQAAHQWWALFLFWLESLGGDGYLPGDATLFAFFLGCFDVVRAEIIMVSEIDVCRSYWVHC